MNLNSRYIIALDTSTSKDANKIIAQLGDECCFYKVGLELFAGGTGMSVAKKILASKKKVFVDLKLLDIPVTVSKAAAQIEKLGANFLTVHANPAALKAAVDSTSNCGILAVTLLTSMSEQDLVQQGITCGAKQHVVNISKQAIKLGCAGVVCSPLEASAVRKAIGPKPFIVTPGIRFKQQLEKNEDQARIATATEAFEAGASHVVIGRAVTNATDPVDALKRIKQA